MSILLEKIYKNRRITKRFELNIIGKLKIYSHTNEEFENNVLIHNISYEGMQISFSNNDFLFKYLNYSEIYKNEVTINFLYYDKEYTFENNKVEWIRVYDRKEKDFYTMSGIIINKTNEEVKKELLDLLVTLYLKDFDLSYLLKSIDEDKFESKILKNLVDEEDKKFLFTIFYHDEFRKKYFRKSNIDFIEKMKLKDILNKIGL